MNICFAPDIGKLLRRTGSGLLLAAATLAVPSPASAQTEEGNFPDKLISLGTASSSGTFYPIGSKLCELVNRDRRAHLLRCVAYRTAGSEYNSKAVAYGDLSIGMTRSDLAFTEFSNQATNSDFNGDALRAVMSLYAMPVVVIARKSANVSELSQLPGHSLNLGNRGSGQRIIVDMLLKTLQLKPASFTATTELNTTEMGRAFCAGKVDIVVEALGNPSPFYRRLIEECDGRIVTIAPATIDLMLAVNPLLERLTIPGGVYAGQADAVPSFGYKAVLVASKYTNDESIRRFVASVMHQMPELRNSDPVLQHLDPEKMFSEGITIPLHDGVTKYFRQMPQAAPVQKSAKSK